jgi:four helix bundle protein
LARLLQLYIIFVLIDSNIKKIGVNIMKIQRFEDFKIWQDSRSFVKSIYNLTSHSAFSKDFGLKDQLQRAAVSILLNISEGFERDNNKEFIRFLTFSKGSAGEVRALLYISLDLNYINQKEFDDNFQISISLITQLSNFINYLRHHKKDEK